MARKSIKNKMINEVNLFWKYKNELKKNCDETYGQTAKVLNF